MCSSPLQKKKNELFKRSTNGHQRYGGTQQLISLNIKLNQRLTSECCHEEDVENHLFFFNRNGTVPAVLVCIRCFVVASANAALVLLLRSFLTDYLKLQIIVIVS